MNEMGSIDLVQNARFEYARAMELYNFIHDWRMKVLGFTVSISGLLALAALHESTTPGGRRCIAVLGVLITALALVIEWRSSRNARDIWLRLLELEEPLQARLFSPFNRPPGIGNLLQQRRCIQAIYTIVCIVWLVALLT